MKALPLRWRRAGRAAFTAVAVASAILVPVTTADAQVDCVVADYQASVWSTGAAAGGFVAAISITNGCDEPVDGWALELTLPPGHGFTHGWSANWASSGAGLTAAPLPWNRMLHPGVAVTIGFVGTWAGTYQDPLACLINGGACEGGGGGENEPPEVTLTRPVGSIVGVVTPCPFVLAADASDPDGSIDRVEFYVNNVLVGTDRTAPYLVSLGGLPPPRPSTTDWVAFARAYDDGVPQLSSDSASTTFRVAIGDPLPESIFACTGTVQVPAGGSEPVRFALFSSTVNQVTLTVTGDPRIVVTPTTVVRSGNLILATVSAAPGSAGARATITATGGSLSPASTLVTVL